MLRTFIMLHPLMIFSALMKLYFVAETEMSLSSFTADSNKKITKHSHTIINRLKNKRRH